MARSLPYRRDAGPEPTESHGLPRWILFILGLLAVAGVMAIVAGGESPAVFQACAYAPWMAPILAAAWMLGIALTAPFARRGLFDDSVWPDGWRSLVAIGLGLGCFSLAMLALGSLHLLTLAGSTWIVAIVPAGGAAVGFLPTRQFLREMNRHDLQGRARGGDWLLLLAAVPVAMLIVAATFPPGTLWASEARGYDVMEYHLEMPREYAANNSTSPVGHNIYSFFPANVEMLYLLLTQIAKGVVGDPRHVWGAFPSQFLHLALMLLTAAALILMPASEPRAAAAGGGGGGGGGLRSTGRAVAVLVFLGVPWTIVTGSLAYNEGGMLFFGTLALGLALGGAPPAFRTAQADAAQASPATPRPSWILRGILIGVMLGLAVGCKQTAGVFFAVPVAVVLLLRAVSDGRALQGLALAIVVSAAVYSPWAIRAAVASGGNPVFPLASSVLGRDGWTPEQSAMFDRGHAAPASEQSASGRVRALMRNSLLDTQWSPGLRSIYIWTRNTPPDDALWKRFGVLWLVVPFGLALAFVRPAGRPAAGLLVAALIVQLLAWMYFTHLQSRFLLPIAVPLALIMARGVQGIAGMIDGLILGGLRVLVATGVAVHAMCTIFLLLPEAGLLGGTASAEGSPPRLQPIGNIFARQASVPVMAWLATHPGQELTDEPPPAKSLLIGDSAAWRFSGDIVYSTVFNTSILSAPLAAGDAAGAVRLLQSEGIQYVLINWTEVDRLRRTYGFDPAITPESIATLKAAGLTELPMGIAGLQLFQVPAPRESSAQAISPPASRP